MDKAKKLIASKPYASQLRNVEKSRKSPPCVKKGGTRSVEGGLLNENKD